LAQARAVATWALAEALVDARSGGSPVGTARGGETGIDSLQRLQQVSRQFETLLVDPFGAVAHALSGVDALDGKPAQRVALTKRVASFLAVFAAESARETKRRDGR
jgi:molybdenum-dependent DNA-binding transcriptional regulator ModE